MQIQIICRPVGEAPEWVRDAWIGLHLPLYSDGEKDWPSVGVMTGPRTLFRQVLARIMGKRKWTRGYAVEAGLAVDLLAKANPDAADWWRRNAPHLLDGLRFFVFNTPACRPVEGSANPDQ